MEVRFARALDAIDRANAADPNRLPGDDTGEPKELVHARMVSDWIVRLIPHPSEALQLAGRAHHLERWKIPRETYPEGRAGYLRWRRELQNYHVRRAREILEPLGYDEETLSRIEAILRKRNLRKDPDVQCFEDALCLVFLETQFGDLARQLGDEKMLEVLRRTLAKMGPHGKRAAGSIPLLDTQRALLTRALKTP